MVCSTHESWAGSEDFFMTIAKVVTNANNENVGETGVKSKEENKNA